VAMMIMDKAGAFLALVWGLGVNSYGTGPNFLHSTAFYPHTNPNDTTNLFV